MFPANCFGQRTFCNLPGFCLCVTQGHINGIPNETRTHSCRFFESNWVPYSHRLVPYPSKKKSSKLLNVSDESSKVEIHTCVRTK